MNTKQIISRTVSGHGLAVLMAGIVALGTLNGRAEHYTLQNQVMVSGIQRLDTQSADGMHFVRDRSAGFSTVFGLFNQTSSYTVTVVTALGGPGKVVITGQIVDTTPNGDQIYYSFRGATILSDSTGIRNLFAQVIKGKVTVIRGTGVFKNVSGSGEATWLVDSNGLFSSQTALTLVFTGEK